MYPGAGACNLFTTKLHGYCSCVDMKTAFMRLCDVHVGLKHIGLPGIG